MYLLDNRFLDVNKIDTFVVALPYKAYVSNKLVSCTHVHVTVEREAMYAWYISG